MLGTIRVLQGAAGRVVGLGKDQEAEQAQAECSLAVGGTCRAEGAGAVVVSPSRPAIPMAVARLVTTTLTATKPIASPWAHCEEVIMTMLAIAGTV